MFSFFRLQSVLVASKISEISEISEIFDVLRME